MLQKLNSFRSKLYVYRFELLMASLLCVFVFNIFFPDNIYGGMAQSIYLNSKGVSSGSSCFLACC